MAGITKQELDSGLKTELEEKLDASKRGAANGVASLGSDGKIPSAQIPQVVAGYPTYTYKDPTFAEIGQNVIWWRSDIDQYRMYKNTGVKQTITLTMSAYTAKDFDGYAYNAGVFASGITPTDNAGTYQSISYLSDRINLRALSDGSTSSTYYAYVKLGTFDLTGISQIKIKWATEGITGDPWERGVGVASTSTVYGVNPTYGVVSMAAFDGTSTIDVSGHNATADISCYVRDASGSSGQGSNTLGIIVYSIQLIRQT